ncbi:MAG: TetR/AcrR family transcriptional regulator [Gemmatales bacterium]|nr:TetR/AcrR family transcriptional regulator [Gemmatales bacterium]MCS7161659.1 TetR/AcrR family transcriptional regulator [Gemmatales bacterium]MDW8176862.1 TetR/AcrR family transcriptional regulator [Gemmatales bacterium]MDW8221321.1 TetR/AcrR family transcriptional regulator [Gemmatales bacterium]
MTFSASRKRGRPVDLALHARRRREILEVAIRLFGQQGYSATDTQQLAQALGVGKGTIYRYFRSKREIFYAALRHVMSQLDEEIQASIRGVDDPLRLSGQAIAAYLRFFQSHPHAVQLLLQELVHFRHEGLPAYFQHRRQTMHRWVNHLHHLMTTGAMRPVPAENTVEIMGDSLFGIMLSNFLNQRQRPPEIQAREVLEVFFCGLLTEQGRAHLRTVY